MLKIFFFFALSVANWSWASSDRKFPKPEMMPSICRDTNDLLVEGLFPKRLVESLTDPELKNLVSRNLNNVYNFFIGFNSTNKRIIQPLYSYYFEHLRSQFSDTRFDPDLIVLQNNKFSEIKSYFMDSISKMDQLPNKDDIIYKIFWSALQTPFKTPSEKAKLICKFANPKKNCLKTFEFFEQKSKIFKISSGNLFTNRDQFLNVITNKAYSKGLSLFALKVLDRIEPVLLNNEKLVNHSDILTDLTHSFIESGQSIHEAQKSSIQVLGAYSVRAGALLSSIYNLNIELTDAQLPNLSALLVLAGAISFLDRTQVVNGQHAYAFPKLYNNKCTYGKPYHFWLSVDFTYTLLNEPYTHPYYAVLFPYTYGVGYELLYDGNGRDFKNYLNLDVLDPLMNIQRMDLMYKAFGSRFALDLFQQKTTPLKEIGAILLEGIKHTDQASQLKYLSLDLALNGSLVDSIADRFSYSHWMKRFDPRYYLSLFENPQK